MKKSFANCSSCSLYGKVDGKVCETNSANDLKDISLFVYADFTDWQKLKASLDAQKIRYIITSPIICSCVSLNDIEKESVASICKINSEKLFDICNPKKCIAIGSISKKYAKRVDEYYETQDDYLKNFDQPLSDLVDDLNGILQNKQVEIINKPPQIVQKKGDNLYKYSIPEKYYTDEYRLVDVQNISSQGRVIYIFRDKNNKKEFYEFPSKENDFYWYESASTDNQIIESYDNLQLVVGNHKNRNLTGVAYGADVNLGTLHSVDYFLQNQGESDSIRKNIVFFDIEVYTFKDKIFPDPSKSMYPINAISFTTDDESEPIHTYLLMMEKEIDSRILKLLDSKKYGHLTIFTQEQALIDAFLIKLQSLNPDFICGWNSNYFDIPYLVGRMKKLSVPMDHFSPFGNVYSDTTGRNIVTGYVCLDQEKLYKELTYITLPSYTLNYVAGKVVGESKVKHEGNLNLLYSENIDVFIEYSIKDVDLLRKIENRVQHVMLQDELRKLTTSSHSGAESTLGQAEGLFLTSMKKKGLIARNKKKDVEKEKLPGAYVFDARGGLYKGLLCDLDFASLYPSIINSWNIGPDTFIAVIDEHVMFDYIYDRKSLDGKTIDIIIDPIHSQEKRQLTVEKLDEFVKENDATLNISGTIFKGHSKQVSIFNSVVSMLFEGRKEYKKLMLLAKEAKDKHREVVYDGKQMAYKILANSLYGALANEYFKFYNINLAKSITLTGQELLKYAAVHCDQYLLARGNIKEFKMLTDFMTKVTETKEVLYGDTDSMFIYLTDFLTDKKIEVKKSPEVFTEIEKIQEFINKTALSEFLKLHKVPLNRSLVFLKNEFLMSKYYTLSGKKHYAAKVISQEGKDINFVDIKGLEIKRSEIPVRSQKFLTTLLNMILNDDDLKNDKLTALVDESRKEMMELAFSRDNSIARVVSYSKPLNEYKNMPQHIKAMLMWNDIVNDDFRYGSKGRLWNIMGFDATKAPERIKDNFNKKFLKKYPISDLDCICIPEDVEQLPEYFIPDVKKMVAYACDDRADNILEPLLQRVDDRLLF